MCSFFLLEKDEEKKFLLEQILYFQVPSVDHVLHEIMLKIRIKEIKK